jgi:hypothetical protein
VERLQLVPELGVLLGPVLAPRRVGRVAQNDLAGHDHLKDEDEEAHEVAAGAAGLLQLGEVVPEGLPLELVRAVVALEAGMTCWLGELTTAPRVSLLDLMPVSRSRTRSGVSRTRTFHPENRPLFDRVHGDTPMMGMILRSLDEYDRLLGDLLGG